MMFFNKTRQQTGIINDHRLSAREWVVMCKAGILQIVDIKLKANSKLPIREGRPTVDKALSGGGEG